MGDLNYDVLSETISESKHLVHIYNTYGLTQDIKEATRITAEPNTLTYYIVTNQKVTVRSTKNLNNDTLIKDLNELPFELIRASADKTIIWSSWKFFFIDILNSQDNTSKGAQPSICHG